MNNTKAKNTPMIVPISLVKFMHDVDMKLVSIFMILDFKSKEQRITCTHQFLPSVAM